MYQHNDSFPQPEEYKEEDFFSGWTMIYRGKSRREYGRFIQARKVRNAIETTNFTYNTLSEDLWLDNAITYWLINGDFNPYLNYDEEYVNNAQLKWNPRGRRTFRYANGRLYVAECNKDEEGRNVMFAIFGNSDDLFKRLQFIIHHSYIECEVLDK